jgi:hypothetical protein
MDAEIYVDDFELIEIRPAGFELIEIRPKNLDRKLVIDTLGEIIGKEVLGEPKIAIAGKYGLKRLQHSFGSDMKKTIPMMKAMILPPVLPLEFKWLRMCYRRLVAWRHEERSRLLKHLNDKRKENG